MLRRDRARPWLPWVTSLLVLAPVACGDDAGLTSETSGPGTTSAATTGGTPTDPTTGEATTTTDAGTSSTTSSSSSSSSTEGSTSSPSTTSGTTGDPSTTGTGTTGEPGEFGELLGDCPLIDMDEQLSPDPFHLEGGIDFGQDGFDYELLTEGGKQIHDDDNLGGSSLYSEIVAYEVLARCDMATLLKTEPEILYDDPMGKKTDLLVELDGLKVGVSVTRAVGFPPDDPYTVQQATSLLEDKLGDVLASSANVAAEDAWVKQILHVIAYQDMHAESLATAYQSVAPNLKADTIVLVTVTHGDDDFVFFDE